MVSNEAGWLSLSPTVKYIFFVQPVMRRHVPVSPGKRNGTGYTAFKGVPLSSAHQHNVVYQCAREHHEPLCILDTRLLVAQCFQTAEFLPTDTCMGTTTRG